MKTALYAPAATAVLAALALAGCQQQQEAAAPQPTASAPAPAPDAKPGIAVTDGVLMLPVVAGRPGVAYFTVANNGQAAATLAAVHIDGVGKAEMHETKGGKMEPVASVDLPSAATVKFERGGKHVMAFEVDDTLKTATTTEMTVSFADGDKISVPLKVQAMAGTSH